MIGVFAGITLILFFVCFLTGAVSPKFLWNEPVSDELASPTPQKIETIEQTLASPTPEFSPTPEPTQAIYPSSAVNVLVNGSPLFAIVNTDSAKKLVEEYLY